MKIDHELVIKAELRERLLLSRTGNMDVDYQTSYRKISFSKDFGILTIRAEKLNGEIHISTHSIKWEKIGHPFVNPFDVFFYLPSGLTEISIGATKYGKRLDLTVLAEDISNFVLANPAA